MPPLDPAIGDGLGKTRAFLQQEILPRFPEIAALLGHDSVLFSTAGQGVVLTSDSFIARPAVFPGGDLGTLVVSGIANDLLCSGAWPQALFVNLMLGPACDQQLLSQILDSLSATSRQIGLRLLGGDTKYLPDERGFDICVAAFGIGSPRWGSGLLSMASVNEGDVLICTGSIGNHAIALLSAREGLGFERVVVSDCVPLNQLVSGLMYRHEEEIVALHDLTRGGLGGALMEVAQLGGCNVTVQAERIPVDDHVRAAAEMLGLDPIFLTNEGKLLAVVKPGMADEIVWTLQGLEGGASAAIIGAIDQSTGADPSPPVRIKDERGVLRILDEPAGLAVPRLC